VPVIAGSGQSLGRNRLAFGPRTGLYQVKQRKAHRLLDFGVAVSTGATTWRIALLCAARNSPLSDPSTIATAISVISGGRARTKRSTTAVIAAARPVSHQRINRRRSTWSAITSAGSSKATADAVPVKPTRPAGGRCGRRVWGLLVWRL